jgi:hypothetical protein
VDGSQTLLELVESTEQKRAPKRGDRSTFHYRNGDISVLVQYIVTSVCEENDEKCEVTGYDAVVTVMSHARKRTVRARGVCGS